MNHPIVQFLQIFCFIAFAVMWLATYIPDKWLRPWMLMIPCGSFVGGLALYAIAFIFACTK